MGLVAVPLHVVVELAIFTCDYVFNPPPGSADDGFRCGERLVVDKTGCSHGRAIEMARERGWSFDRLSEKALCPSCQRQQK